MEKVAGSIPVSRSRMIWQNRSPKMIDTKKINQLFGLTLIVTIGFLIAPGSVGTTDITLNHGPIDWGGFLVVDQGSLSGLDSPLEFDTIEKFNVVVTAYSSSIWETWGCPYTTASNTRVRDGIVANNMLPFGTEVRFPELFGDKVFVVEDRMNRRKGDYHFDIWFASRVEALQFGFNRTYAEVIQ
jgi:3D (Asp-Asp-Asp) domain-containing protein